MEKRERDAVSRNNMTSTDAGRLNRQTSEKIGKSKSDSSVDFGQKIGRSEMPESEPSRRTGGTGTMSSTGNMGKKTGSSSGRH